MLEAPIPPVLEVQQLSRRFPGVLALDHVNFDIVSGEVHALVGENGAGKSTLINILAGVLQPSTGQLLVDGQPIAFADPLSSQRSGISVIFQEFNLLPHLSVAENVFVTREPRRGPIIDWETMNRNTRHILQTLNLDIDPTAPVGELAVSQQQLVEIARALSVKARVIIMDEPTAALNEREVVRLLEIVRSLASSGVSVIYVSHRLTEVFSVADRITVFRDGRHIQTTRRTDTTEQQVVATMVGRELAHLKRPSRTPSEIILEARELVVERGSVRNVSFSLRGGEVLALAGLMGSGCSELMEALFGLREITSGTVTLAGKPLRLEHPRAAIRSGIGLVPEDRKTSGLFPDLPVTQNLSIGALPRLFGSLPGILDLARERVTTLDYQRQLNIRFSRPEQRISGLSGGNQQKVILARALAEKCRVLLLAEPTRGVDVGAKAEIYALIDRLVEKGIAIILQTSELPELIRLADRCIVLVAGEPRRELSGEEVTQEAVMEVATGLSHRVAVQPQPMEITNGD
ncbi:MAG TPA: sugar ABC transporter ATP-binding protein [Chthoniobacterales bacterium]|nr:sugar ABC transporter ATP-binding protein [Chthoniobacterales bacterium]